MIRVLGTGRPRQQQQQLLIFYCEHGRGDRLIKEIQNEWVTITGIGAKPSQKVLLAQHLLQASGRAPETRDYGTAKAG